ncbi:MAG: hypothetical protein OES09_15270, partial [Gammaproteobacteria bacterium]|nr:hypothetical protein [Gammaproteobacteria bacterium]
TVPKMKIAAVQPPRIGLSAIETRRQITAGQSTSVRIGVDSGERKKHTAKVRVKVFADGRELSNQLLTLQLNPQTQNWKNVNVGVPSGAQQLKIDAAIEGAAAGKRSLSRTVAVVQPAPVLRQAVPADKARNYRAR